MNNATINREQEVNGYVSTCVKAVLDFANNTNHITDSKDCSILISNFKQLAMTVTSLNSTMCDRYHDLKKEIQVGKSLHYQIKNYLNDSVDMDLLGLNTHQKHNVMSMLSPTGNIVVAQTMLKYYQKMLLPDNNIKVKWNTNSILNARSEIIKSAITAIISDLDWLFKNDISNEVYEQLINQINTLNSLIKD